MNFSKSFLLLVLFSVMTSSIQAQAETIDFSLLDTKWEAPCEQPIDDTSYMDCFIDVETITFSVNEEKTEGTYNSELIGEMKFKITKDDKGAISFSSKFPMFNGVVISLSTDELVLQDIEREKNYIYKRQK